MNDKYCNDKQETNRDREVKNTILRKAMKTNTNTNEKPHYNADRNV